MRLSAVVLTKNEANNIGKCLKTLSFCDEIIVVDDYSNDGTLKKISEIKFSNKNLKIKVFQRRLGGDFSSQRNFGLEKATGEWVLFLDADEQVSGELEEEIKKAIKLCNPKIKAFYIKRRDFWWGRELRFGEVLKVRNKGLIRLVKKNSGVWKGKVHEEFNFFSKKFAAGQLNNFINHYPHQSIEEFLDEINFYSTFRAMELLKKGKKTNIFEIIIYPLAKFFLNYIINFGFLDGAAGFAYAFLMSFHSFLVRVKLYHYLLKKKNP